MTATRPSLRSGLITLAPCDTAKSTAAASAVRELASKSIKGDPQVTPAIPCPLLAWAPIIPATLVSCPSVSIVSGVLLSKFQPCRAFG